VNATKAERQSDGSTEEAQDLQNLSTPMKDGQEPSAVLLALLRSPFLTLQERGLALLASANYGGKPAIIVIIKNANSTSNGWEFVGDE
jgi:hypothetical protein